MNFQQLHLDHIPCELTIRDQWVGFKVNGDKKTPCVADNPIQNASCTNHKTWRPFTVATEGLRNGAYNAVAYALNGDFVGVDLDDCLRDGKLTAHADKIIKRCDSYSEASISGTGIHILLAGQLPTGRGRRLPDIEIYGQKRFFIATGNRLPNSPVNIRNTPDTIAWLLDGVTETTDAIYSAVSAYSVVSVTLSLDELIIKTTPKRPRERNARLFDLARGLRFNLGKADSPLSELKQIVRRWHKTALPVIRTKDFDETWSDFVHAWMCVQVPFGADLLSYAWQRSQNDPAPSVLTNYDSKPVCRLICLCHALAVLSPKLHFFLSTHEAARLLNTTAMQIHRWLNMLVADGIIGIRCRGNEHRATRYRWTSPAERIRP